MHIDIYNDINGQTVKIGKLEEFIELFIAEVGSVTFTVTKSGMRRKAVKALDRVIQKARDDDKLQR